MSKFVKKRHTWVSLNSVINFYRKIKKTVDIFNLNFKS